MMLQLMSWQVHISNTVIIKSWGHLPVKEAWNVIFVIKPLNLDLYSAFTWYWAVHRKDTLYALVWSFCTSRKGGTGAGRWMGSPAAWHAHCGRLWKWLGWDCSGTWWLLLQAMEMAWLKLGGTILPLLAKRWLENGCLLAKMLTIASLLMSGFGWANECVYCGSMSLCALGFSLEKVLTQK